MKKLNRRPNLTVRIVYSLMCLGALSLAACKDYDDSGVRKDINNLENRVSTLEEWQKSVNTNIASLQSLVNALETGDYITSVQPVAEGFLIKFKTSPEITVKHGTNGTDGAQGAPGTPGSPGAPGETPVIGIAQDGVTGTYYWTVKIGSGAAEPMKDGQGNYYPVTGADGNDGVSPQMRINPVTDEWEISTDNGIAWTSTGVKATGAQGDAIFQQDGIDLSDPDNVTFTLADGTTTLTLPRTRALTIGFDSYETFTVTPQLNGNVIPILFPDNLRAEDYVALVAELKHEDGTDIVIATRGVPDPVVQIEKPTFDAEGRYENNAKVIINCAYADGKRAVLKVTVIDKNGQELSVSRIVEFQRNALLDAAQNGGEITLTEDYIFTEGMPALVVPAGKSLVINLNGKTIESKVPDQNAIMVDGGKLTVNGNGLVKCVEEGDNYAIWAIGNSEVTINGGTYVGYDACIQTNNTAHVDIYGGHFSVAEPYRGKYYVINLQDNEPNTITVYGGTFENSDPSDTGTEPAAVNDNFVADGYVSVKISDTPAPNGTYSVVRGESVSSIPELKAAVATAGAGDAIKLEPGTYAVSEAIVIDKNITFLSSDPANTVLESDGNHPVVQVNAAKVTIDGITIRQTTDVTSTVALIELAGNVSGSVIQNSTFEGSFDLAGGDGQVVRAIQAYAGQELTIIGNRFINVRQPAYIEGPATIKNNYAEGTKGWVITQTAIVDMTGNTFGQNAVDIAIILENEVNWTDLRNYEDARVLELHTLNGNAHVENQVRDMGETTSPYESIRKDGSTYNWEKP